MSADLHRPHRKRHQHTAPAWLPWVRCLGARVLRGEAAGLYQFDEDEQRAILEAARELVAGRRRPGAA